MTPSPGYGWRSRRGWAPAVRPGLKPRAQSASPLKGAVRRPGARVDRLGAGAVGVSRLQPAWGLSPAVHGRAVEDTAARLIGAACRARRVGHAESPRPRRGGRGSASPLHLWVGTSPVRPIPVTVGPYRPSCRGQAPPDPPAREGRQYRRRAIVPLPVKSCTWSIHATAMCRARGAAGEAAPRPYTDGSTRRRCNLYLPRWGRIARPVGVRRCLTRRAGRAGHRPVADRGCAIPIAMRPFVLRNGRAYRRGRARRCFAPTPMGRHVAGATDTCHGGAVSPVLSGSGGA